MNIVTNKDSVRLESRLGSMLYTPIGKRAINI